MHSLILIDRVNLGVDVLRHHGQGATTDYDRLVRLLAPGEAAPEVAVWALDAPKNLLNTLRARGWYTHNRKYTAPGLVECCMASAVMRAPESINRVVFVSGNGVLAPIVGACLEASLRVVIAGYPGSRSKELTAHAAEFIDLEFLHEQHVIKRAQPAEGV